MTEWTNLLRFKISYEVLYALYLTYMLVSGPIVAKKAILYVILMAL